MLRNRIEVMHKDKCHLFSGIVSVPGETTETLSHINVKGQMCSGLIWLKQNKLFLKESKEKL